MIEYYLHWSPLNNVANQPAVTDNQTVGVSVYYEVYHGADPKAPASGDEDVDCTYWVSEANWNSQACMAYDDKSGKVRDTWDSVDITAGGVRTYQNTITNSAACVIGTDSDCWDVVAYRVSGQFANLYKPKYASDKFNQCVITWGIGANDFTKCSYSALSTVSLGCTNNGVIADATEVTLGFAALFGALSFF